MTEIYIKPYETLDAKDYSNEVFFTIKKEDFENVEYQEGRTKLNLSNCKFKKIHIKNIEQIDFQDISLHFIDCYIEDFKIEEIESNNVSVSFSSCIIKYGNIKNSNLKQVDFNNCIIANGGIFLSNLNSIRISYTEENIFPKRWENLYKSIAVANCKDLIEMKQNYYIYDSKIINFSTNEVKSDKRGVYNRDSKIEDDDYKTGYYLNADEKKLLNVNILIKYSTDVEKVETKIIGSLLNSLSLSGYCNGKIYIENTKINNLYIHDFSSQDELAFFNISPHSTTNEERKIEFRMSNLDKARFDNIDFNKYSIISLYKTKLGKATFTSCNFPTSYTSFEKFKSLANVHYPNEQADNYYKDQYEIFLQLKQALESTGNFYESQKLQAISNDALKKISDVSAWDKLILWINSKSNNHGLSIKRPLVGFLIFSILLYIMYLWSIGRIFNSNEVDFTLVGYYFSFIDLTHRSDFLVNKEQFNFGSLSIDYLNKIISSFFIYQFVAAFRKYGKK